MIDQEQIVKWVEDAIAGTDAFIVEVKITPSRLLVFLDKPSGITIDECSKVSRYLVNTLEESAFLETHDMEVSSPGMDQPLKVYQQYIRRIGREVKLQTLEGAKYSGIIKSADQAGLELEMTNTRKEGKKKVTETSVLNLPYSTVKETKLIITFKK